MSPSPEAVRRPFIGEIEEIVGEIVHVIGCRLDSEIVSTSVAGFLFDGLGKMEKHCVVPLIKAVFSDRHIMLLTVGGNNFSCRFPVSTSDEGEAKTFSVDWGGRAGKIDYTECSSIISNPAAGKVDFIGEEDHDHPVFVLGSLDQLLREVKGTSRDSAENIATVKDFILSGLKNTGGLGTNLQV